MDKAAFITRARDHVLEGFQTIATSPEYQDLEIHLSLLDTDWGLEDGAGPDLMEAFGANAENLSARLLDLLGPVITTLRDRLGCNAAWSFRHSAIMAALAQLPALARVDAALFMHDSLERKVGGYFDPDTFESYVDALTDYELRDPHELMVQGLAHRIASDANWPVGAQDYAEYSLYLIQNGAGSTDLLLFADLWSNYVRTVGLGPDGISDGSMGIDLFEKASLELVEFRKLEPSAQLARMQEIGGGSAALLGEDEDAAWFYLHGWYRRSSGLSDIHAHAWSDRFWLSHTFLEGSHEDLLHQGMVKVAEDGTRVYDEHLISILLMAPIESMLDDEESEFDFERVLALYREASADGENSTPRI